MHIHLIIYVRIGFGRVEADLDPQSCIFCRVLSCFRCIWKNTPLLWGRKAGLCETALPMRRWHHQAEDGVDEVLLFVVDILKEEATLLVPNDLVKGVAEKSFGATVEGDLVVLPGIMSRKKQIIPNLKV